MCWRVEHEARRLRQRSGLRLTRRLRLLRLRLRLRLLLLLLPLLRLLPDGWR